MLTKYVTTTIDKEVHRRTDWIHQSKQTAGGVVKMVWQVIGEKKHVCLTAAEFEMKKEEDPHFLVSLFFFIQHKLAV